MKRACYYKNSHEKYELYHVISTRNNGKVDVEPINEFKGIEFDNLEKLFVNANLSGYGIIGSLEEVEKQNLEKYNKKRNGLNLINIDDL